MRAIFLLFGISIASLKVTTSAAQDLVSDSTFLVNFYNSTGGEFWTSSTNWNSGPVSTWEGVTVSLDAQSVNRVTGLSLPAHNVAGSIPAGIDSLSALQVLDLSGNSLTGSIPAGLFTIGSLTTVDLSFNSLTGNLPDPTALVNLQTLYLEQNGLDGSIPSTIGNLTALVDIDVSNNLFTGSIPGTLFPIESLTYVDLSFNGLSEAIPDVSFSPALYLLDLRANLLTGAVPTSITAATALTEVYLENNLIADLPDMSGMQSLTTLQVFNNLLDFGDLEPNISITFFSYDPQGAIPKIPNFSVGEGDPIDLTYVVGGTQNIYQWYLEGSPIPGATSSSYNVGAATLADEGSYYLEISSSSGVNLILTTENTFVTVLDQYGGVIQQDYEALEALYNATAGAGWTNSDNWLNPGMGVANWFGVSVVGDRVTSLSLSSNNLIGNIPVEIGNLTALEFLYLNDNELSGGIPSEVGSLTGLQYLSLSSNQLTGNIPAAIGLLTSLSNLDLSNNQLSGSIPVEIGGLSSLSTLNLFSNGLSGSLPEELWSLSNLSILNLFINQFTGSIPENIGGLANLTTLQLTSNQFSGSLPVALGSLANLSTLAVNSNQFSGTVPAELGSINNLTYLGLGDNEFTDLPDFSAAPWASTINEFSVHSNFFQFDDLLPNMSVANFIYNGQNSIPPQTDITVMEGDPFSISYTVGGAGNVYQWYRSFEPVGTDSNVYSVASATVTDSEYHYLQITNPGVPGLTLSTDQTLVTVTPAPLQQTDSLALVAIYNALGGTGWFNNSGWLDPQVPESNWYGVTVTNGRVSEINLPNNGLVGQIPADIGQLDSLKVLNLNSNGITDPIPLEIGDLSALTFLALGDNYEFQSITELPATIGNLTNLFSLDISANGLQSLPQELGSLSNLHELTAGSNQFSSLPDTLRNLTALTFLSLDNNQLNVLPDFIGNFTNLNTLNLSGNGITSIPASFNNLTALESVFLSYNQLSEFPAFVLNSSATLTDLFVQVNPFTVIPDLSSLTNLQSLGIGGPNMTAIPAEVFLLTGLNSLYVQSSPLGVVPGEILNLTNLQNLSLFECGLTGVVPISLATMPSLDYLDLGYNSFDSIPDLSSATITTLSVYGNSLQFGELEKGLSLPFFYYTDQKNIPAIDEANPLIGQSLLIRVPVSGSANEYQWYKDDAPLAGLETDSLFIESVTAADAGVYRLEIVNNQLPGLTLRSDDIFLNAISPVLETDSLALVALYNAAGGASWTNNLGWLQEGEPVGNWYGVTVVDNRVTALNLSNNNLSGTIPVAIGDLTNLVQLNIGGNLLTGDVPAEVNNLILLQELDLSNNTLVNLPDLTGLTAITNLNVSDNNFTFEDLEPNVGIGGINYSYQKDVPFAGSTEAILGSPFTLSVPVGGTGNLYQWFKQYSPLDGAVSATYLRESATASDRGVYFVQISNPAVPDLTLRSEEIDLEILSSSYAYESGYIFWKHIGAEQAGIFQHFPSVVAVDGLGNIYALDKELKIINKFSAAGDFLFSISYLNDLPNVSDIEADAEGNLYVSDETSSQIVKYDASGNFGYFIEYTDGAYGIAVGSSGDIYFLPRYSQPFKVRRHDGASGSFVEEIELSGGPEGGPEAGIYLGFELDSQDNIYLLEPSIGRLDKYTAAGVFTDAIDLVAEGYALWSGWFFTVAETGDIYLQTGVNDGNGKIFYFGSDGTLVSRFGDNISLPFPGGIALSGSGLVVGDNILGLQIFDFAGNFVETLGPLKDAPGQFNQARQIAIDSQGNRYICDFFNGRIQKFDNEGNFITVIGSPGNGTDQLSFPISIAIDEADNLYIADSGNNRIQKFTSGGVHLATIGSLGVADGQFDKPVSVVISSTGFLFVADANNLRIQKFDLTGTHVLSFGTAGAGEGQFSDINAIAIEDDGTLLVNNNFPSKWIRFNEEGQYLEEVFLGIDYVQAVATDNQGAIYVAGGDGIGKADKGGGLLSMIGTSEMPEQEIRQPLAVSSNAAGDTLWVSSSPNRISIFYQAEPDLPKLDSLTLVELYHSTGGAEWTNRTNWLSGEIASWFGVTAVDGRVVALSLPNNNLVGSFPVNFGQLELLQRLVVNDNQLAGAVPQSFAQMDSLVHMDIRNNELEDLPDLSGLNSLGVETGDELLLANNRFQFDDLVPNLAVPNISYAPQKEVAGLQPVSILELDPISLSVSIGGDGNVYQWYKDSVAIAGATTNIYSKAAASLTDAGTYYLTANNAAVAGLTLVTAAITLNVDILSVSEVERSALEELYNATAGGSWTNKTNWLVEGQDVSTWYGITVVEGKVQKIDLSGNNLVGAVPASLANLTALTELVVANNQLTDLPDLSALGLTVFDVSANQLTFEDLEPNMTKLTAYGTQAKIPSGGDRSVTEGQELSLQFTVGGESNTYQWVKDAVAIAGATSATYTVAVAQLTNSGDYFLEVRNTNVPDLVISTETFKVNVTLSSANGADSLALVSLYNSTSGAGWTNKANWLTGPVNTWQGVTVESGRVVSVVLSANNLIGSLPLELFSMSELRVLNLSNNKIGGSIPDSFAGWRKLQQLYLQGNQIASRIPSAFGSLVQLTALNLGANKFYGNVPSFLGNLTNLETILSVRSNELVGTIPGSIGALTKLRVLAMDNNQLEGAIPGELGAMSSLEQLYLHANHLSGSVPAQLSTLSSLTTLYLSTNQLEGNIPAAISTMGSLRKVALNNNQLSFIPGFTATLDSLNIAENKLGFGSIEPNMQIPSFIYAPQGKYGIPEDTLHNVGESFTFAVTIDGSANGYQWYKGDAAVEGETAAEYTLAQPDFPNEGVYHAKVTNSLVPDLVIQTEDYAFKLSSIQRDSLALVAIYNATGGPDWINSANWLEGELSSWAGITVTDNRVSEIVLPNNRVVGNIPSEIRDIGQLQVIDFSNSAQNFDPAIDNQIRSVPSLRRLQQLTKADFTRNRLGFTSIEPNFINLADKFSFKPQRRFGETRYDSVFVNTSHRLEIDVSGAANVYQWYFNDGKPGSTDTPIAGANNRIYYIDTVAYGSQGIYYAEVTSPLVPDFGIRNRNQNVTAVTTIAGTVNNTLLEAPLSAGEVSLYMIRSGPFLDLGTTPVAADGSYLFAKVPLADYLLLARPDATAFPDALLTYYSSTLDWAQADTLTLREPAGGVNIGLLGIPPPLEGDGIIAGALEADLPDEEVPDEESRVLARGRVKGAGVSLSRQRFRAKGTEDEVFYEFVAYTVTDENGEFSFGSLPDDTYLINIQFPGVPMDQSSELLLTLGEDTDEDEINVAALVTPGGIAVNTVLVKGIPAPFIRDLVVYPNPGEDLVQLEYFVRRKVTRLKMTMADIRGQQITQSLIPFGRGAQRTYLDLSGLAAGMYIITITDDAGLVRESFRVQKK